MVALMKLTYTRQQRPPVQLCVVCHEQAESCGVCFQRLLD